MHHLISLPYLLITFYPVYANSMLAMYILDSFFLTSIWLTPHHRLNAREGLREADRADTVRTNVISDLNFRGPQFTSTVEEGAAVRIMW